MNMKNDSLERWTVDQSVELYGIRTWGSGYFDISPDGVVIARLPGTNGEPVKVKFTDIVEGLRARGMSCRCCCASATSWATASA